MNISKLCRNLSAVGVLALAAAAPCAMQAQEQAPKVLDIVHEFTKPGKDGMAHEKTESAYINALNAAKSSIHYIAFTSLSGPGRALFLTGYSSFAEMEAEHKAVTPALGAAMDRANQADSENLSAIEESMWLRRDDLSSNTLAGGGTMRLMEITLFVVKPGHEAEFAELAKLYSNAAKTVPEFHWTAYELAYGSDNSPSYLILSAYKSASELDAEFGAHGKLAQAVGDKGMKRLNELEASCIEQTQTNLFAVSPKMSRAPESMVDADPKFWKPAPPPAKH